MDAEFSIHKPDGSAAAPRQSLYASILLARNPESTRLDWGMAPVKTYYLSFADIAEAIGLRKNSKVPMAFSLPVDKALDILADNELISEQKSDIDSNGYSRDTIRIQNGPLITISDPITANMVLVYHGLHPHQPEKDGRIIKGTAAMQIMLEKIFGEGSVRMQETGSFNPYFDLSAEVVRQGAGNLAIGIEEDKARAQEAKLRLMEVKKELNAIRRKSGSHARIEALHLERKELHKQRNVALPPGSAPSPALPGM